MATLPTPVHDGNNERGVFVDFLLCGCLWEIIMVVGKFDVDLKFDVGVRFFGKRLVGMEALCEKNVQPKAGWANAGE